ncbi:hypothetical protein [Thalassotalea ganghwensis]
MLSLSMMALLLVSPALLIMGLSIIVSFIEDKSYRLNQDCIGSLDA